jgi:hypothetical protein
LWGGLRLDLFLHDALAFRRIVAWSGGIVHGSVLSFDGDSVRLFRQHRRVAGWLGTFFVHATHHPR